MKCVLKENENVIIASLVKSDYFIMFDITKELSENGSIRHPMIISNIEFETYFKDKINIISDAEYIISDKELKYIEI